MMMWPVGRVSSAAAALLLLAGGDALAQQPPPGTPPSVETAAVTLAPVARKNEFVGTVEADNQVNLVARVEGFLDTIGFVEGSFVKAGSTAFQIEKDTYQAALAGAQAALQAAVATQAGAAASLRQAELTLVRQQELVKSQTVSQAVVDQATAVRDNASAQLDQATAQIAQAQAQVKTAELNLSFTDIIAPISGRIGKAQITVGNLVAPASGTLATIVQTDPILVAFSISDREYLQVIDAIKPNDEDKPTDTPKYLPQLTLSDGSTYGSPGKIGFIDNQIDSSTGTIAVYAEFPNPNLQLIPGQYVSVTVQTGDPVELAIVPAAAILQDRDGPYVFVLGDGNRATVRRVKLAQRVDTNWAVESGLANGEVIIVSGLQRVKPGIVVAPTPAKTGN